MAELILYMAKSGSGKTSSLRNLPPEETILITPNSKSLPFPGGDANYEVGVNRIVTNQLKGDQTLNPEEDLAAYSIEDLLEIISDGQPAIKYVVIDDFTHFFSARIFSQAFLDEGKGKNPFERWNVFGSNVFQALFEKSASLRDDMYIIILHHTEIKDDGSQGFKSPGKLLDNTIDVPSYFTYIFHGVVEDSDKGPVYLMQTNNTSARQAKTPYGLYDRVKELYIPNDMMQVVKKIEKYKKGELKIVWN